MRRDQPQSDYSRPPSYRSRTSSTRPTLDPNGNTGCSTAEHSRDPSLSLSESGGGSGVVNVISVVGGGVSEPEPLPDIKLTGLSAEQDVPLRMMTNKGTCHSSGKDGNLVTIVQTGGDSSPVIVTVSGSTVGGSTSELPTAGIVDTEMEILAHLWWLFLYGLCPTCGPWSVFCLRSEVQNLGWLRGRDVTVVCVWNC